MPYGLIGPTGYQGIAEQYLGKAGAGYQNPYGGMLGDAGQGLLGQYQRSVVPAQRAAAFPEHP